MLSFIALFIAFGTAFCEKGVVFIKNENLIMNNE